MTNRDTYRGIDFAVDAKKYADLTIVDTGTELRVDESDEPPLVTAVDCPFGTTSGFVDLLNGRMPPGGEGDPHHTRDTEKHTREQLAVFKTKEWWLASVPKGSNGRRPSYFNGSSHVQPAAGLVIVPAGIAHVLSILGLGNASPKERIVGLERARRGEGPVVEAHPRIFLYSAVERIFHHAGKRTVTLEALRAVARYKAKKAEGKQNRRQVYALLQAHPVWMGLDPRSLRNEPPPGLLDSDHAFDAWLSALTAWAHAHGETLGWQEAGLSREKVDVEGHMLYLRTESSK